MTFRERVDNVTRGLICAVLLLCATGPASAQTSSPAEGGPAATSVEAGGAPAAPDGAQNPPPQVQVEPAPDGFRVGLFTFRPGGRIKLDLIKDFDALTSEDSFDPRTIVIPEIDGANSRLHARETRLFLDIRAPVGAEGKELRMYLETDFYGSSSTIRLRHAYGSYG